MQFNDSIQFLHFARSSTSHLSIILTVDRSSMGEYFKRVLKYSLMEDLSTVSIMLKCDVEERAK